MGHSITFGMLLNSVTTETHSQCSLRDSSGLCATHMISGQVSPFSPDLCLLVSLTHVSNNLTLGLSRSTSYAYSLEHF